MINIKKFIALFLSAAFMLNSVCTEVVAEEVTEAIQNIIEEHQQSENSEPAEDEIKDDNVIETANDDAPLTIGAENYNEIIKDISFDNIINGDFVISSENNDNSQSETSFSENTKILGTLTIKENNELKIAPDTVVFVKGNLVVEKNAILDISEGGIKFIVTDDVIVEGNMHLSNSGLYVCKNITENGVITSDENGMIVLLGSEQQTIDIHSRIGILRNKNTSSKPLNFKNSLNFERYTDNGNGIISYKQDENGNITDETGTIVINDKTTFFVRDNKDVPITDRELIIHGDMCIDTNDDVNIAGFIDDEVTLRIKGNLNLQSGTFKTVNQNIIVEGNYIQSGGTFVLNGENALLEVCGDITLQDDSVLQMQEDNSRILADGNFTVNNKSNVLKTGTIEIKGNFKQISYENNFDMISSDNDIDKEGLIKVKLTGSQNQEISFESPTLLNSDGSVQTRRNQFAVLELTKPRTEYVFKNDLTKERVYEKLIEPSEQITRSANSPYVLRASMNIPRSHFELINAGGYLYAIGGKDKNGNVLDDISRYDYESNTWNNIGKLSSGRMDYAAVTIDEKIYIIGGYDGTNVLNDIEVISDDGSVQKLELANGQNLIERKSHKAVYYNKKIYIIGGERADGTVSDIVEILEINSKNILTTNINIPRKDFGASLYYDGTYSYIVIAGGENSTGILNSAEQFNFSTELWTSKNEMSMPRKGFDLQYLLGSLYAVGGLTSSDSSENVYYTSTVDVFDGSSWSILKDSDGANICTSEARAFSGSAQVYNSIFIAGGETPSVSGTFEQFMPVNIPAVRFKGDVKGLNGDFTQEETDLVFNSAINDFALKRVYNTQFKDEKSDFLGYGWKFNFESTLKTIENNTGTVKAVYAYIHDKPAGNILTGVEKGTVLEVTGHQTDAFGVEWCQIAGQYYISSEYIDEENIKSIEVTYPDGMKGYFKEDGNGNYTANFGTYDNIQYSSNDSSYVLTTKDQTKYIYTEQDGIYKNTCIKDKYGNEVKISYSSNKIKVEADTGDTITIERNDNTVKATDGNNRTVLYQITDDELKFVTDSLGFKKEYDYNDRNIIEIKDVTQKDEVSLNKVEYDDSGRISKLTDVNGKSCTNQYVDVYIDESNAELGILGDLQRTVTDQNGNKTLTKYSLAEKRPVEVIDAEGGVTSYKYEVNYNGEYVDVTNLKDTDEFYKNHYNELIKRQHPTRETVIDQNNQKTVIEKDQMGNITKIENPDRSKVEYKYDEYNNLLEETSNTNGHVIKTVYTYNGSYLQSVTCGNDGSKETYTYDQNTKIKGLVSSKTSAGNRVTTYTYNDRGELISESTGGKTAYYDHTYGNSKTVSEFKTADNKKTEVKIDAPENDYEKGIFYTLVKLKPDKNIEITQYDNKFDPVKITKTNSDGTEKSTSLIMYDIYGRKIKEIPPNVYSDFSNLANSVTDGCHIYRYNNAGLLISETDEENNTTQYEYDNVGNIALTIDPGNAKYSYKYDGLNRLIEKSFIDADGKSTILESFSYECGGNNAKSNRAYSQLHYETIDENTKLVTKTCYDYAGRETLIENPYKIIEKEYYGDGNLKRESVYENLNGNDTYIKGKCTSDILYFYNDRGLLETKLTGYEISDKGTYFITKYRYTPDNLLEYEIAYLKAQKVSLNGTAPVPAEKTKASAVKYEYDETGNVLSESSYINDFSISELSSLRFAKRTEKEYDYSNYTITEKSGDITTVTSYNYLDKPVEIKNIVNKEDFTASSPLKNGNELVTVNRYDLNGNLTETISPSGNVTKFSYDDLGRLVKTEYPDITSEDGGESGVLSEITEYNWAGKVTKNELRYKDQIKSSSKYIYDSRNNLLLSMDRIDENGQEAVSSFEYNTIGMVTGEASPSAFSSADPDEENLLKKYSVSNASSHTNYYYDMIGRLKASEFEGKVYDFDPDLGEQLQSEKSFVTSAYKYDANDNIVKEVSGEEYEKAYSYLKDSDIDSAINFAAGTVSKYSGTNTLLSQISPNGQKNNKVYDISCNYDAFGIVTEEKVMKGNAGSSVTAVTKTDYIQNEDGTTSYTQILPDSSAKTWKTDIHGNSIDETLGKKTINMTYNCLGLESNSVTEVDRDDQGNVINSELKTIYDAEGNAAITISNSGTVEINTYDNLNRLISKTVGKRPSGISDNALTSDKLENSVTQKWVYDVQGNVRYEYDGEGFKTEYQYDMLGRLVNTVKKYDDKTHEDRMTYDADGNLISEQTLLNGKQTGKESYVYDGLGRVVQSSEADSVYESMEYNRNGDQICSYDADNVKTEYKYDSDRQLTETIVNNISTEKLKYDLNGNVSEKTDGENNKTIYHYDIMDRLDKVSVYDKSRKEETEISSYTYNTEGNIYTETVGSKNRITYEYTASDQIKETNTNGRKETFSYDCDGNLAKSVDPSGNVKTYTYTPQGWVTEEKVIDINNNVILSSYTYDKNGNTLTSKVTQNGKENIIKREYDKLGRVTKKEATDSVTSEYIYDIFTEENELCEITRYENGKSSTKVYDDHGREKYVYQTDISAGNENSKRTEYSYDKKGRRESIVYPNGAKSTYEYFPNNNIKTLTNSIKDTSNSDSGYREIEKYEYTYLKNNNIESKKEIFDGVLQGITSYKYDELLRLVSTEENRNEQSYREVTYSYDDSGNRSKETTVLHGVKTVKDYSYDESSLLTGYTVKDKDGKKTDEIKYEYDKNGNQTKEIVLFENGKENKDTDALKTQNKYNALNQLIQTKNSDFVVNNEYNAEGLRISKEVKPADSSSGVDTSKKINYTYEYDNVVFETDAVKSENEVWNLYGLNLISRQVKDETFYYMYNGHADVTRLIDENGEVSEKYYYDEFGNETGSFRFGDVTGDGNVNINDFSMIKRYLFMDSSELSKVQQKLSDLNADGKVDENDLNLLKEIISVTIRNCPADTNKDGFVNENNSIKYAGYYYDAETGLYYLNSRFYDPENARFMQEDSYDGDVYDPLSLNLYTYCANNPISYYDPTGHSLKSIAKAAKKVVKSATAVAKTAVTATKAVVKETVKTVKTAVNVVKPVAKATVKKAVETVKNIPNELKEDWEVGINQLKDGGTAGKLFAAYSEGVVNNLENNALGLKELVTDPKNTINEIMTDFVNDPIKPLENLVDFYKDIAIASYKGDYETVAYKLGQGTVTVAITGTAYCFASSAATAFLPEGINLGATLPSLSFDTLAVAGFDSIVIPSIEAVSVSVSVSSAAVATAAGVATAGMSAQAAAYNGKFDGRSSSSSSSKNNSNNRKANKYTTKSDKIDWLFCTVGRTKYGN